MTELFWCFILVFADDLDRMKPAVLSVWFWPCVCLAVAIVLTLGITLFSRALK